ncbi:MAG TPA: hypothetical protein PLH39_04295 [Promineifilum sp.]|nr:hypothetical protein [Promineifilum sp.]
MANAKVTADPTWYGGASLANQTAYGQGAGFGQQMARKVVAFDGNAGNGQIGTVALFTVTGAVAINITAICTETLVGAATLECGTPGATAGIIAQIANATALATGEIWYDGTPTTVLDTLAASMLGFVIGDGADIQLTVGAANITDGTIEFTVFWTPLTANGNVVAV